MLEPKSDASMHLGHVCIARVARLEDFHTYPANVCPATPASHMIAALGLLHRRRALGTIFDVKFPLQSLEGRGTTRCNVLKLGTSIIAMSGVARGAKPLQTIGTGVSGRLRPRT